MPIHPPGLGRKLTASAGLSLHCAALSDGHVEVNDGSSTVLDTASVTWTCVSSKVNEEEAAKKVGSGTAGWYKTPVYLFPDRQHLLFSAPLPCRSAESSLLQTGAAIMAAE